MRHIGRNWQEARDEHKRRRGLLEGIRRERISMGEWKPGCTILDYIVQRKPCRVHGGKDRCRKRREREAVA